jgi:catechol 2,3-dioxygenase-like lactoylglutathione lyase family enzyme
MSHDIDHPHHVGLVAVNLDEATDLYERLGFRLTPPSHHVVALKKGDEPQPLGTANVTAMFERSYIEILAQVREDVPMRVLAPWLAKFPGFHILALNSPDADAVAARLDEVGIAHGGVGKLEREVDTPEGPQTLGFRTLMFGGEDLSAPVVWPDGGQPEGGVQAVQELTPQWLHQERHMDHPNGAVGLADYILCVADEDIEDIGRRYSKYLGREAVVDGPRHVFELDQSRITLVPSSRLEEVLPGEVPAALPAFVAFDVAVRDLAAARELVEGSGFPLTTLDDTGRFFVPSSAALGGAVIFSQA